MNSYEVYNHYLCLKQHFAQWNFNYREKRNMKFISREMFDTKRTERHFCEQIAQKVHPLNHLIYGIVDNPRTWLRQIARDDDPYFKHRKIIEGLLYHFTKEVELLTASEEHPFINHVSQHPRAARLYFGGRVSIETLAIINQMTNYADHWCTKNRMLTDVARHITKYMTFLPQYDRDEFTNIIARGMISRQKEYNLEKTN